jgi:uncharacterized protein YkwD
MLTTLAHLFTPHHTNNYRARILQPAGLIVLMALFVISQSSMKLFTYTTTLPGGYVLGYASNINASQTVELSNLERSRHGLPPLNVSSSLNQAAIAKANHMFQNNYWAHIAPDGTTPWVFIKSAGYAYTVAGENLARDFDSTDEMVRAWMSSPTHRDNILNEKYAEIGIGVVNGTLNGMETTLVVQMFGQPSTKNLAQTSAVTAEAAQSPPPAPTSIPAPTQAAVITVAEEVAEASPATQPFAIAQDASPPQQTVAALLDTQFEVPVFSNYNKVLISPLLLTKSIATSMIFLLLGVLVYDSAFIHKHKLHHRRVGKNWAHLTMLVILFLFVAMIQQGHIL